MASLFTKYAQGRAEAIDWLSASDSGWYVLLHPSYENIIRALVKEAKNGNYNKQREQYLAAQHHMAIDQGHSGEAGESKKDIHKHH